MGHHQCLDMRTCAHAHAYLYIQPCVADAEAATGAWLGRGWCCAACGGPPHGRALLLEWNGAALINTTYFLTTKKKEQTKPQASEGTGFGAAALISNNAIPEHWGLDAPIGFRCVIDVMTL